MLEIALTIDDGLLKQDAQILQWQLCHQVPAWWFLIGHHSTTRRIHELVSAGALQAKGLLQLANHSWSHSYVDGRAGYRNYYQVPSVLSQDLLQNSHYFVNSPVAAIFDEWSARAPGRNMWSLPNLGITRCADVAAQAAGQLATAIGFTFFGWHVCDLDRRDPLSYLLAVANRRSQAVLVANVHAQHFAKACHKGGLIDALLRLRDRQQVRFVSLCRGGPAGVAP